ncbi:MAG: hypothetical protein HQL83_06885 [Magnetococcales bacterium]|nr:hypothetical protein [Magnetococcales bacterium]MBF0346379.1 hypothetical protein [Magnetococcales bacterium]MBF0629824.1 hypothetical protein [Magnetococcales bacterium]
MKYSLQPTGYKESDYERPTPEWVCGKQRQGKTCRRGPDAAGQCRGHGECDPVRRGDRWFCTRPETAGGPCRQGPLPDGGCGQPVTPCIPCRSHRAIVKRVTRAVSGLAIALLLVFLSGSWRLDLVAPGDLSPPHAALQSCALCHSAFEGGLPNWLVEALGRVVQGRDSDLCLKCHPRVAQARWPHNLNPDILVKLQKESVQKQHDPHSFPPLRFAPSCSVCHREHTGGAKAPIIRDALLCNSCHRKAIDGFSVDHPEFTTLSTPKGPLAIDFDHASHFKRHFQGKMKEHAPTRCGACHQLQADTGRMLHAGFDTACSACHVDQIRGESRAGFKGFPVLSVPGFDTRPMQEKAMNTGQWPEMADGELTPFMRWLLRDDPKFAAAWNRLKDRDWLDLGTLTGDEAAAVADMVWSIKGFFGELNAGGHEVWARRFHGEKKLPPPGDGWGAINGGLEVDTLKGAVAAWFPDLDQELTRHGQGGPVPYPAVPARKGRSSESQGRVQENPGEKATAKASGADEGLLDDQGGDALLDDAPKISPVKVEEGVLDQEPAAADSLLAETPAAGDGSLLDAAPEQGKTGVESSPPVQVKKMDAEEWNRGGGWYRMGYALYYRPGGHGDPFLRSWLQQMRQESGASVTPLRALLSAKNAPGECNKCHLDLFAQSNAELLANRSSEGLEIRTLTRFSHKPHLKALHDNCQECHTLGTPPAEESTSAETVAPRTRGFTPMQRKACADCHTRNRAGEDCLQCHKYHARPE